MSLMHLQLQPGHRGVLKHLALNRDHQMRPLLPKGSVLSLLLPHRVVERKKKTDTTKKPKLNKQPQLPHWGQTARGQRCGGTPRPSGRGEEWQPPLLDARGTPEPRSPPPRVIARIPDGGTAPGAPQREATAAPRWRCRCQRRSRPPEVGDAFPRLTAGYGGTRSFVGSAPSQPPSPHPQVSPQPGGLGDALELGVFQRFQLLERNERHDSSSDGPTNRHRSHHPRRSN